MDKFLFLLLLLLISTSASFSTLNNARLPGMFIFGDSILDAGNNHFNKNCSAQADFPPYGSAFFHQPTGRFTNGRTVPDFISQFIGIEFQKPYLEAQIEVLNGSWTDYPSNGINFASAGSGVLQGTNEDWGVIPLQDQLQQFQTLVRKNKIDPSLVQKSVFLFESGSNDIFDYFLQLDTTPKLDPDAYVRGMVAQVAKFIDQIYKLGARKIVVVSLGPVGCVPARAILPGAPIDRCYGKMNVMVKNYNKGLENLTNHIPIKYPHAIGVYGAVYNIFQQFRATPKPYGFSEVSSACCGYGTLRGLIQCGKEGYEVCSRPNEFLFWDYFHPSEHAYELISKSLWEGNKFRVRPINLKTLINITRTSA
ncbi:GDSL esterase/lipase 6 [Ziziphus jujuba]|uniref:GDSL esterase/lipase 6 n=1 Tax=Ziziphus jujuba TaxID=326968 RepID=A0A6P4B9J0_ZIZJJ|nr:GDSL esterase/lipase 6 [Ziziphus jujuba]